MAELIKKETLVLPKVKKVRLLSVEELKECNEYVTNAYSDLNLPENAENDITSFYYLSTPGEDDKAIMLADGRRVEGETDVDYYDHYAYGEGSGNRPVLEFAKNLNIDLGEKIQIGNWTFTIISKRLAFLDAYISLEIFDKETNAYEESEIKERVDYWFESEIEPNL